MRVERPVSILVKQYRFELECWVRQLSFQRDELVYCKNRLAEVVNESAEEELLLMAERFEDEFLAQERIVSFLAGVVQSQARLLEKQDENENNGLSNLEKEQKKLRRDIKKGEAFFAVVKDKFLQFLNNRFYTTL